MMSAKTISRMIEQLKFCISQKRDNSPLLKVHQLVSSVFGLLLKEEFILDSGKHKQTLPQLSGIFSQFKHLICLLCSIVNELWV